MDWRDWAWLITGFDTTLSAGPCSSIVGVVALHVHASADDGLPEFKVFPYHSIEPEPAGSIVGDSSRWHHLICLMTMLGTYISAV